MKPRAAAPGTWARAALALLAVLFAAAPSRPQTLPTDSLVVNGMVFHFAAGGERLAQRLGEVTVGAPPLPALPPEVLTRPVHIYLARDERSFARLSGGNPPEWGAGIAILGPGVERIVLPAYSTSRVTTADLPRVLRHELAHVALQRWMGDARVPRWFHEGYSRWAAGELDFEAAWQLRLAFALGDVPPLDSLGLEWPGGRLDARIAYLLSASAIDYLVAEGGVEGLRRMLERWRASGDLDQAMRATYGVTVPQFEEHWRTHVRSRYGWALVLTHSAVFWAIAALLLVLLVLQRRRRDRRRLERMSASDPPDTPDWWNDPLREPPPPEPPPPERPPGSLEGHPPTS